MMTDFLTLTFVGFAGQCVWYPYSAVTSLGLGGTCGWVLAGAVVQLLGSV